MSENQATSVAAPIVLTKAERIAKLVEQVKKLNVKIYNLENDIVEVKPSKEAALPTVGTEVLFNYGRRTETTEPVQKLGVVVAVKPVTTNEQGKRFPAQVKVMIGNGFDQEFVVIYPAQIIVPEVEEAAPTYVVNATEAVAV